LALETVATINGSVLAGPEGNLGRFATGIADDIEHLPGAPIVPSPFPGTAAIGAAGRFVFKAFAGVEFLFSSGKDKFLFTITTDEGFILIHGSMGLLLKPTDFVLYLGKLRGRIPQEKHQFKEIANYIILAVKKQGKLDLLSLSHAFCPLSSLF
jgi:hypothetical protein